MPAIVKLNKQELNDLINSMKEKGEDTSELDNLMTEVIEDERMRRPVRRVSSRGRYWLSV